MAEHVAIHWPRNVLFFKVGVTTVKTVAHQTGNPIGVMLHIAQPENVEPWYDPAAKAGLPGLRYIWSEL